MTLDGDEIQSKLSRYTRQISQIHNFEKITSGWENEVYSFTAEYDNNHKDLILRIYPGDHAEQKSAKEFNAIKRLHEAGFPVPMVYILEHDNSVFGKPFIIMEKIKGRMLWEVLDESNENEKMKLVNQFCRIFVDLHNLDWRLISFEPLPYDDHDSYGFINYMLLKILNYLDEFPNAKVFMPVFDWLMDRHNNVPCERLSAIHLDYHPANLILKDDGNAIVIDWTNFDIADFRIDLAWTILLVSSYGNPEGHDIVLNEYEKIIGQKIEQIEYFEVFALLRRLFSIFVSLTVGADKLGMRPEAAEIIKSNVRHIRTLCDLLYQKTGITVPEMERLIAEMERTDENN
jgi:aminoglycoside phosphotransferase (APT) family kinase protein